jgi:Tfp pilus assembly protein PilN
MIEINLRPGQKRKRAGIQLGGAFAGLRSVGSGVKDPLFLAAAAAVIGVVGWLGWNWVSTAAQFRTVEPRLESVREENRRFQNIIAQKRREETIRDSLVSQIQVIRQVDGDRFVWPHVLDEVAKALPPYTWLVDLSTLATRAAAADSLDDGITPRQVQFQINGRTVDIQAYTRFLRQLEASPWLHNVSPVSAQTVVDQDRPLSQSVR